MTICIWYSSPITYPHVYSIPLAGCVEGHDGAADHDGDSLDNADACAQPIMMAICWTMRMPVC